MIDPNELTDEMLELAPEKLAEMMGVVYRTAYKHITKNGWRKIEGFQGTVKYVVPKSYIDQYLENMKKAKEEGVGQGTIIGPSLVVEKPDIRPVIGYENERLRNDKIEDLKDEILELRSENFKFKTMLGVTEEKLTDQRDSFDKIIKEKDDLISVLKDQVSQEKEHIQAEKSRADMASNQLMNSNALIKRREDAPAVIDNPEVKALKERLEKMEQKSQEAEALRAELEAIKQKKPWQFWR